MLHEVISLDFPEVKSECQVMLHGRAVTSMVLTSKMAGNTLYAFII